VGHVDAARGDPAALSRTGADPDRVAIGGISMGGFGALDLARLAPGRFCAVGAHSAALWFAGADTPGGAFDDGEDFARHDVLAAAAGRKVYRVPVWIDVGRDDPFFETDTALAERLRSHGTDVRLDVHGGGHSGWSSRMPAYLRFYVSACRR
jgi:S-formylglutathione hydrolase FrmB